MPNVVPIDWEDTQTCVQTLDGHPYSSAIHNGRQMDYQYTATSSYYCTHPFST